MSIKPCPRCGGKPMFYYDGNVNCNGNKTISAVVCSEGCGFRQKCRKGATEGHAASNWNRAVKTYLSKKEQS